MGQKQGKRFFRALYQTITDQGTFLSRYYYPACYAIVGDTRLAAHNAVFVVADQNRRTEALRWLENCNHDPELQDIVRRILEHMGEQPRKHSIGFYLDKAMRNAAEG